jgi:hypothetical protein
VFFYRTILPINDYFITTVDSDHTAIPWHLPPAVLTFGKTFGNSENVSAFEMAR